VSTAGPAPKVFISYRREETAGHAGRLYDAMAAQFEDHNVFMDVDLAPGVDFVDRITKAVGACHVLLVVMGPRWATLVDEEGNVRIAEQDDFVRLEVETALRRSDVTVIPVLVAGARMPDPDHLPQGLRPLARRNALELSDMRWRYDVQRLIGSLRELLAGTTGVHEAVREPAPAGPAPRSRTALQLVLEGVLVAVIAGVVGRWLQFLIQSAPTTKEGRILNVIVWRGEIWALVGAALAVWLTLMRGDPRDVPGRMTLGLLLGGLAGALGGAAFALPRFLPDHVSTGDRELLAIASFAVTGGLLGALVGRLWIPRRVGIAAVAGLAGGALIHAAYISLEWNVDRDLERMALVGIDCFVITAAVLLALLGMDALNASRSEGTGARTASAGFG
jgi:TIR domain